MITLSNRTKPVPATSRRHFNAAAGAVMAAGLTAPGAPRARQRAGRPGWPPVRFGLVGDVPYGPADEGLLRQVMQQAGRETSFLVHVGDIKGGGESCRDELLTRRVGLLNESPVPLMLAPGDNEWTDCSRLVAGSYSPTERLAYLRTLLRRYPDGLGSGTILLQRPAQGTTVPHLPDAEQHPEFIRWQAGPCLFVVLNVPGSANGLTPHISDADNEQRALQNTAWLLDCAEYARHRGLPGLVICMQADLAFHRASLVDATRPILDRKHPYAWVRALLMRVVASFPGTVLLLNGDRHRFVSDTPFAALSAQAPGPLPWDVPAALARARLARFRRIQSYGWPFTSHYVVIEIRQGSPSDKIDPPLLVTVATRVLSDEPPN